MSPEEREKAMTKSMYRAVAETNRRKGLGRWPVTAEIVEERKQKAEAQRAAEARARAARAAIIEAKRIERGGARRVRKIPGPKPKGVPPPADSLAGRIRKARVDRGISMAQLERNIRRSSGTVSTWESGEYVPAIENLVLVARALGVTTKWLTEGDAT